MCTGKHFDRNQTSRNIALFAKIIKNTAKNNGIVQNSSNKCVKYPNRITCCTFNVTITNPQI